MHLLGRMTGGFLPEPLILILDKNIDKIDIFIAQRMGAVRLPKAIEGVVHTFH